MKNSWRSPGSGVSCKRGNADGIFGRHKDANRYTRGGWGGGLYGLVTVPATNDLFAFTAGFETANLLSETVEFRDPRTQLRVEQQTSQTNYRIYVGPEFGGHANGFFRPHAGANVAMHIYDFGVDVVVPDDITRENEIRQNLKGNTEAAFGYDVSLGANFNFGKWFLDGGARFTKSFRVPQTLGDGSVSISSCPFSKFHPHANSPHLGPIRAPRRARVPPAPVYTSLMSRQAGTLLAATLPGSGAYCKCGNADGIFGRHKRNRSAHRVTWIRAA